MLTAEQQSALVAALELGSEVPEIGTGGWEKYDTPYRAVAFDRVDDFKITLVPGWYHIKRRDNGALVSWLPIEHATQEHYDAACARLARWLAKRGVVIVNPPNRDGGRDRDSWIAYRLDVWSVKRFGERYDDELAAYVAACREVRK